MLGFTTASVVVLCGNAINSVSSPLNSSSVSHFIVQFWPALGPELHTWFETTFIFALPPLSACSQSVRLGTFFSPLCFWHTTVCFPCVLFEVDSIPFVRFVCFLESYLFTYLLRMVKYQWNLFCNMNSYSFVYYWQVILETITMDKDIQWNLTGSEWLTICC